MKSASQYLCMTEQTGGQYHWNLLHMKPINIKYIINVLQYTKLVKHAYI